MSKAYVVLAYTRLEDGMPTQLAAAIPAVRPIIIGGSPSELRLPGTAPAAEFARITCALGQYQIEPCRASLKIRLNDVELPEEGRPLHDGDVLTIDGFRLTFHEGALEEERFYDLNQRWGLYQPPDGEDADPRAEDPGRPYIDEFELVVRPLKQNDQFGEIRRRAEGELKRLLKIDEMEALDSYAAYLWWLRLLAAADARDADVDALARDAFDLHGDWPQVLCAAGLIFLRGRDWAAARRAYARLQALQPRKKGGNPFMVHEARAALHLIDLLEPLATPAGILGDRPIGAWEPGEWSVPGTTVGAPGDEIMMWFVARNAELFGPRKDVRFIYRGQAEHRPTPTELLLRWELLHPTRRRSWRFVIRAADTLHADPSLLCEIAYLRDWLERADPRWPQQILNAPEEPDPEPPLRIHDSAVQALQGRRGDRPACLRVSPNGRSRRQPFQLAVVTRPEHGDTVYSIGELRVALAPQVAARLHGATVSYPSPQVGFLIETAGGERLRASYRPALRRAPGRALSPMLMLAVVIGLVVGSSTLLRSC